MHEFVVMAQYGAINQKTQELKNLYLEMNREIRRMNHIVTDLDIFWDGDAQAEFLLAYNRGFTMISAIMLKISKTIELLLWALSEYQKTENIIEQMIGGIRL